VIGTSNKENEYRLPIHPSHMPRLDPALRDYIWFEQGYGQRFGIGETYLRQYSAGIMGRTELFERCDVILLPKPTEEDFHLFQEGQILWGWPHCVQGEAITQVGIDKRMTYIAWEAMYAWKKTGVPELHTFYKNNELAGYCSVLHALQLKGITGHYGPRRRAAILSFGSTARGALYALRGMGITDITVYTQRPSYAVQNQIPAVAYRQIKRIAPDSAGVLGGEIGGNSHSFAQELASYDIIVNCILQDTDRPLMFVRAGEQDQLKPGTLIIDVSCDFGMGFAFAEPTSFEEPAFEVGDGITYYAVDHSPTYLWDAATFEISQALLPHVSTVLGGKGSWRQSPIIQKAIEIQDGVIQNPKILSFQKRAADYPHLVMGHV
jgi:alanine dehydrogenase